jgi:dephospho-CoA kinase
MAAALIGLTGGIGSGKSTVAGMLAELGACVIDADRVGHDVYRPGSEGFRRVHEAFGAEVVAGDGTIDRQVLGARVFALLSDEHLKLQKALDLPVFEAEIEGENPVLLKRLALIADDGVIGKVFYPVFPPEQNAVDVLDWLRTR